MDKFSQALARSGSLESQRQSLATLAAAASQYQQQQQQKKVVSSSSKLPTPPQEPPMEPLLSADATMTQKPDKVEEVEAADDLLGTFKNTFPRVDKTRSIEAPPRATDEATPVEKVFDVSDETWMVDRTEESAQGQEAETNMEREEEKSKVTLLQRYENLKCILLGSGVALLSVTPFTTIHFFWYKPMYTSVPQWEFDTKTAAIQGALFALTYRYALREDVENATTGEIRSTVLRSFVWVRALSRIHLPMECTALPLYCTYNYCLGGVCMAVFLSSRRVGRIGSSLQHTHPYFSLDTVHTL